MHTRTFTNVVLTVIATLLLVLVLQRSTVSVDPATPAHAATGSERHVPQQITTDPAVAAATEKVAMANSEIAKQIGEVAGAIKGLGRSMDRAARMNK